MPVKNDPNKRNFFIERLTGIEPVSSPWQGEILPLNHSRSFLVPGPRVELGTPASSGQRSTDELARQIIKQLLYFTLTFIFFQPSPQTAPELAEPHYKCVNDGLVFDNDPRGMTGHIQNSNFIHPT